MRLAPVPLYYAARPSDAVRFAAESSRTTHGAAEAVDACRYYAALIVGALAGREKRQLLAPHFAPEGIGWAAAPLAPAITAIAEGSYRTKSADDIRASGYVVHTVEAALWAFFNSDNFRDGALLAVNLGEDAARADCATRGDPAPRDTAARFVDLSGADLRLQITSKT